MHASTPMMRALAAAIRANVPTILWGQPGVGKALDVDTSIPTPDGWTTMGDLAVGDLVLDERGWPTTVLATYDQPDGRECFDVTFDDGSVIRADAEHLWETHSRSYRLWVNSTKARTRRRRGTDAQIAAIRAALVVEKADTITTISAEAHAFESVGITTGMIRDASRSITPIFAIPTHGHIWFAADVAAAGLPVAPGATYVGWSNLMSSGVSKTRAKWALAKIKPVIAYEGSIFARGDLLAETLRVLLSYPYDQRKSATTPFVLNTAQIAASLLVEGGKRSNHAIPVAEALDLPDAELAVAPYTLGAWLGDGTSASPQITTMDDEIIQQIEADGYSVRLIPSSVRQDNQARVYGLSTSMEPGRDNGLTALLRGIDVLGNKHIPAVYLRASEAQRRALLAGLLDTDGTCGKSGYVSFTVTNERLARDTHELALSLGYKASLRSQRAAGGRPGHQVAWTVGFTTSDKVFRLSRKSQRQVVAERGTQNYRYIVAVEPVDSVTVRCITVDSPNHLYLAGRTMIPTHNTAKLTKNGEAWGYHVETVVGGIREASDFMGLPLEINGEVHYAPLQWARNLIHSQERFDKPRGLLFLDELTTAAPSVQKAMLRIAQERFVGDHKLPDTVAIVAAANPPEVAVDGWDLEAPVANRFMHLDWKLDLHDWAEGVATHFEFQKIDSLESMTVNSTPTDFIRVSSAINAFLMNHAKLFHALPTDPHLAGKGWPSPRSWENAMKVLSYLADDDEDAKLIVLKGCVGEGAAVEYFAWLAAADLHDPVAVMADPSIVDWKTERPDRLFALTTAVTALAVSDAIPDAWTKAITVLTACAKGGKPDVATPGARTLLNRIPKGKTVPAATKDAFADQMTRIGMHVAAEDAA